MTKPSPWQRFTLRLGWWLRGALALFPLTGCVSPMVYTMRLPKSRVRIAYGSQAQVYLACGGRDTIYDSGSRVGPKDDIVACWHSSTKTIYAENSFRGAKAAAMHERAHEEGVADPDKEGYDWP